MTMKNKETPLEIGGVKLYTVKDIAKAMEVEEQTVRRYIKRGFLQSKKIGRNIFITEAQLKEFIEANK
jgi:excisionase family DNA binding protein